MCGNVFYCKGDFFLGCWAWPMPLIIRKWSDRAYPLHFTPPQLRLPVLLLLPLVLHFRNGIRKESVSFCIWAPSFEIIKCQPLIGVEVTCAIIKLTDFQSTMLARDHQCAILSWYLWSQLFTCFSILFQSRQKDDRHGRIRILGWSRARSCQQ